MLYSDNMVVVLRRSTFEWLLETLRDSGRRTEHLDNYRKRGKGDKSAGEARGRAGRHRGETGKLAYRLISEGANYYQVLIATAVQEMVCSSTPSYGNVHSCRCQPLVEERGKGKTRRATAIRQAVDRAWGAYHGVAPPAAIRQAVPPEWWKDPQLTDLNKLATEVDNRQAEKSKAPVIAGAFPSVCAESYPNTVKSKSGTLI